MRDELLTLPPLRVRDSFSFQCDIYRCKDGSRDAWAWGFHGKAPGQSGCTILQLVRCPLQPSPRAGCVIYGDKARARHLHQLSSTRWFINHNSSRPVQRPHPPALLLCRALNRLLPVSGPPTIDIKAGDHSYHCAPFDLPLPQAWATRIRLSDLLSPSRCAWTVASLPQCYAAKPGVFALPALQIDWQLPITYFGSAR
jgi:hypothetical protein